MTWDNVVALKAMATPVENLRGTPSITAPAQNTSNKSRALDRNDGFASNTVRSFCDTKESRVVRNFAEDAVEMTYRTIYALSYPASN